MSVRDKLLLELAKLRRKIFQHYTLVQKAIVLGVITLIILTSYFFLLPLARIAAELLVGPVNIVSLINPKTEALKNENSRTNVLLLGAGGALHEGPNLTDTIIIASLKTTLSENDVVPSIILISLPRDIYLDSLQEKINAAYEIGSRQNSRAGLALAKSAVWEISGLPIHYAVKVDFSAFEKVTDILGGINLTIERVLDDPQYPLPGKETDLCAGDPEFLCRYEHLYFPQGRTHLDGQTALKFVRSRHALGEEGTDFARIRRQQLVLAALKDKFFSTQTFLNPSAILAIYEELKNHIETDFDQNEAALALKIAWHYKNAAVKSLTVDLNLLEAPPVDHRGWVLTPKDGDFTAVHQYVKTQLEL